MEAALYDPEEGYYSKGASIGHGRDFVTSPSISPLFARCVARVFAKDAEQLPGPLVFLEAAAASGGFLRDFSEALRDLAPDVSSRTRLQALERSEKGRRDIVRENLAERVFSSAEEIGDGFSGWIFSNELFDALPVHRVRMKEGRLWELGVALRDSNPSSAFGHPSPIWGGAGGGVAVEPGNASQGRSTEFVWTSWPAPAILSDYLARFDIALADEQIAELNLDSAPLYRRLCDSLTTGRIVTFDYGHRARVLYHSEARPRGTLAVHSKGRRGGDPLDSPGSVDLTAHVNWDDLIREGEASDLSTSGIFRQTQFLLNAGLFEDAGERKLEALRLLDPEGLGDDLSVLIQSKGMAPIRFPVEY